MLDVVVVIVTTYYLPIKCTSSHGNLSCFVCISVLDGGCSHAMVCLVKSSSYTEFQLSETEQIFLWEGSNIDCNFHADRMFAFLQAKTISDPNKRVHTASALHPAK